MGLYNKVSNVYSDELDRFVVITVATERNENLQRFEDSCKKNDVPYLILGLGDKWESGRAENGVLLEPGGAQKIIYLRDEIKNWDDLENTIILFSDSYDVIFNDGPKELVRKFREFNSPVVFSAEKTCWPNSDIANEYPEVDGEYKYLNSGGFVGYGNHILKMVDIDIQKSDDDQEYYTSYFLDDNFLVLDYKQNLFQTLNLAVDEVKVESGKIHNTTTNTTPSIVHGNGPNYIKERLEVIYNELNSSSSIVDGSNKILINLFLDFEVGDIDQVFDQIRYLNYPKFNIDLRVYYNDDSHTYKIDRFIKGFGGEYHTLTKVYGSLSKSEVRDLSLKSSLNYEVDYVINMDCNYIFRNRESIKLLMKEGKNIISPMIVGEGTEWVNFWFRTDSDGYVVESEEQNQIKKYQSQGNFSVGYLTGIIVFKSSIISDITELYGKNMETYEDGDFDINFSRNLIRRGYQLWTTNNNYYGGII